MATIVHVEKNGILKCVGAAEPEIEFRRAGERGRKLRDEFIEASLIDVVRSAWFFLDEPQLLQRDVQEMIGMLTNVGEGSETAAQFIERGLNRFRSNTNDDEREDGRSVRSPFSVVVPTICYLVG